MFLSSILKQFLNLKFGLFISSFVLGEIHGGPCAFKDRKMFDKCPEQRRKVSLGEDITIECRSKHRVDICAWINPNGTNTRPLENDENYVLVASSNRDCNMRIKSVQKDDIGLWSCNPFVAGVSEPASVKGSLVLRSKYSI